MNIEGRGVGGTVLAKVLERSSLLAAENPVFYDQHLKDNFS